MNTPQPDAVFVQHFARRREIFLAGVAGAVASLPAAVFRPIDARFTFGRALEQGPTGHPLLEKGGLEYGLNYLRHMIDQGFDVAYAVSLAGNGIVHMQAWEDFDEGRRAWPDDPEIVFDSTWHPMRAPRPTGANK